MRGIDTVVPQASVQEGGVVWVTSGKIGTFGAGPCIIVCIVTDTRATVVHVDAIMGPIHMHTAVTDVKGKINKVFIVKSTKFDKKTSNIIGRILLHNNVPIKAIHVINTDKNISAFAIDVGTGEYSTEDWDMEDKVKCVIPKGDKFNCLFLSARVQWYEFCERHPQYFC